MNRFIVISPDAEKVQQAVQENFPDQHYQILPGVWAVAGTNKVPSDICDTLGIGGNGDNSGGAGVVFVLDAYNGFYNPSLWEKLNLWGEL